MTITLPCLWKILNVCSWAILDVTSLGSKASCRASMLKLDYSRRWRHWEKSSVGKIRKGRERSPLPWSKRDPPRGKWWPQQTGTGTGKRTHLSSSHEIHNGWRKEWQKFGAAERGVLTSTRVTTIVSLCLNLPLQRAFPLTTCKRWRGSWAPRLFKTTVTRAMIHTVAALHPDIENEHHQVSLNSFKYSILHDSAILHQPLVRNVCRAVQWQFAHHIVEDVEVLQAYSRVLADAQDPQGSLVNSLALSPPYAQLQQLLPPTTWGAVSKTL